MGNVGQISASFGLQHSGYKVDSTIPLKAPNKHDSVIDCAFHYGNPHPDPHPHPRPTAPAQRRASTAPPRPKRPRPRPRSNPPPTTDGRFQAQPHSRPPSSLRRRALLPLRDANAMFSNPFSGESAYLDNEPQHPTVAETGSLSRPGPGPRAGQLKRRESEPMPQRRIIRLASFGGEGLVAKPAGPCPGEIGEEEAVV
ncbi:hypothetical protein CcaverHIS631_0700350 [Cutaneotrichosporon cavernicola]|nr:hypothetical protein CcaverHIS631_0700350 [Cutaneotrichosporon cavernicola]